MTERPATRRLHEQRWTHDRTGWGHVGTLPTAWDTPGAPWHDEPDKVQWIDEASGLDCLAVRNRWGAWCGYVGVPPGHRYHGVSYDDVDVTAHGGLTFADLCDEEADDGHGICHVPLPGRPARVWWLGFDCGHAFDLQPRLPLYPDHPPRTRDDDPWGEQYRTLAYVQEWCAVLAHQLSQEAP